MLSCRLGTFGVSSSSSSRKGGSGVRERVDEADEEDPAKSLPCLASSITLRTCRNLDSRRIAAGGEEPDAGNGTNEDDDAAEEDMDVLGITGFAVVVEVEGRADGRDNLLIRASASAQFELDQSVDGTLGYISCVADLVWSIHDLTPPTTPPVPPRVLCVSSGIGEELPERLFRMPRGGKILNISSSAFCGPGGCNINVNLYSCGEMQALDIRHEPYVSKGSGIDWRRGSKLGSDL